LGRQAREVASNDGKRFWLPRWTEAHRIRLPTVAQSERRSSQVAGHRRGGRDPVDGAERSPEVGRSLRRGQAGSEAACRQWRLWAVGADGARSENGPEFSDVSWTAKERTGTWRSTPGW
jgi:hypothetical protein